MSEPAQGAAITYIEGLYGGPTEENEDVVSVGATVTKLVDNNPEALAVTFINTGATTAYILFNDGVSSTRGIILAASGGYVSMDVRTDQTLPTRAWYAVCPAGTTDIFYIRTQRYALTYSPPIEHNPSPNRIRDIELQAALLAKVAAQA